VDITEALDALAQVISEARPRALGGGAIIDRERAMALMQEVQQSVPEEIRRAHGVLGERDALIEAAAAEADQIRENARHDAAALVADDEITVTARSEAMRIIDEAHAEAQKKRAQIDAYVDGKLAAFEGVLQRTLEEVGHGRAKLAGQWEPAGDPDAEVR
jgi:cell division septum initiation protein DivIVA